MEFEWPNNVYLLSSSCIFGFSAQKQVMACGGWSYVKARGVWKTKNKKQNNQNTASAISALYTVIWRKSALVYASGKEKYHEEFKIQ